MTLLFQVKEVECPPVWKPELFIRFVERVCHLRLSSCVFASFPVGFEGVLFEFIGFHFKLYAIHSCQCQQHQS